MLQYMKYEDDFNEYVRKGDRKLVIYGAGNAAQIVYPYLENVSYVCDQKADGKLKFHDLTVLQPEALQSLSEKVIILICVKDGKVRCQIKETLKKYELDAKVFELYNNIAFDCFHKTEYIRSSEKVRYVRLVCRDDGWIFTKFAQRMQEQLELKGVKAIIGECADVKADINHYIAYPQYEPIWDSHDTLMITHIDSVNKLNLLKHQLKVARMGICMSRETMNDLAMHGIPREKLCYINPAQDGVIKPRKYVLGITHRVHEDYRKRVDALIDICDGISPDFFEFKIMGDGWEQTIEKIRAKGFTVTYYPEFDYDTYIQLMPSLDYYLFWGFDEGSMGYLDALAAGIGTIVTPQGFHLDTRNGLTYPCRTIADFVEVLSKLEMEKRKITDAVADWTWGNYVDKHLEVWKYVLGIDEDVYVNKHRYEDGIFSVLRCDA